MIIESSGPVEVAYEGQEESEEEEDLEEEMVTLKRDCDSGMRSSGRVSPHACSQGTRLVLVHVIRLGFDYNYVVLVCEPHIDITKIKIWKLEFWAVLRKFVYTVHVYYVNLVCFLKDSDVSESEGESEGEEMEGEGEVPAQVSACDPTHY